MPRIARESRNLFDGNALGLLLKKWSAFCGGFHPIANGNIYKRLQRRAGFLKNSHGFN
ncbi:hypothetical protein [Rubripirellula amarantea]|uniref:hypothetical protein n=1 Tax=Rubripirellula amarantea TaxID=2527999 RepID=UPI0013EF5978|nr:hypothetical protein [Rubripirellula amarantea]